MSFYSIELIITPSKYIIYDVNSFTGTLLSRGETILSFECLKQTVFFMCNIEAHLKDQYH